MLTSSLVHIFNFYHHRALTAPRILPQQHRNYRKNFVCIIESSANLHLLLSLSADTSTRSNQKCVAEPKSYTAAGIPDLATSTYVKPNSTPPGIEIESVL